MTWSKILTGIMIPSGLIYYFYLNLLLESASWWKKLIKTNLILVKKFETVQKKSNNISILFENVEKWSKYKKETMNRPNRLRLVQWSVSSTNLSGDLARQVVRHIWKPKGITSINGVTNYKFFWPPPPLPVKLK